MGYLLFDEAVGEAEHEAAEDFENDDRGGDGDKGDDEAFAT